MVTDILLPLLLHIYFSSIVPEIIHYKKTLDSCLYVKYLKYIWYLCSLFYYRLGWYQRTAAAEGNWVGRNKSSPHSSSWCSDWKYPDLTRRPGIWAEETRKSGRRIEWS